MVAGGGGVGTRLGVVGEGRLRGVFSAWWRYVSFQVRDGERECVCRVWGKGIWEIRWGEGGSCSDQT